MTSPAAAFFFHFLVCPGLWKRQISSTSNLWQSFTTFFLLSVVSQHGRCHGHCWSRLAVIIKVSIKYERRCGGGVGCVGTSSMRQHCRQAGRRVRVRGCQAPALTALHFQKYQARARDVEVAKTCSLGRTFFMSLPRVRLTKLGKGFSNGRNGEHTII
jgi:hypothetical protein